MEDTVSPQWRIGDAHVYGAGKVPVLLRDSWSIWNDRQHHCGAVGPSRILCSKPLPAASCWSSRGLVRIAWRTVQIVRAKRCDLIHIGIQHTEGGLIDASAW